MATKADFTDEEWAKLTGAPMAVTMAVVTADMNGPIGVIKEIAAMANAESAETSADASDPANALAIAVADDIKNKQGDGKTSGQTTDQTTDQGESASGQDMEQQKAKMKADALAACQAVSALLAQKVDAAEAETYKRWLLDIGQKVAQAAKEGFLGMGGTQVTEKEKAMLADLGAALGLSAAQ